MSQFAQSKHKHLQKEKTKELKKGCRCYYCRRKLHPAQCKCRVFKDNRCPLAATWDHFKPKSKGGTDKLSNLVLACWECNLEKGIKDGLKFMQEQGYI